MRIGVSDIVWRKQTLPTIIPKKRETKKSNIPIPLTCRAYEHFYSEQRIKPIAQVRQVPKHLLSLYGGGSAMAVRNHER